MRRDLFLAFALRLRPGRRGKGLRQFGVRGAEGSGVKRPAETRTAARDHQDPIGWRAAAGEGAHLALPRHVPLYIECCMFVQPGAFFTGRTERPSLILGHPDPSARRQKQAIRMRPATGVSQAARLDP